MVLAVPVVPATVFNDSMHSFYFDFYSGQILNKVKDCECDPHLPKPVILGLLLYLQQFGYLIGLLYVGCWDHVDVCVFVCVRVCAHTCVCVHAHTCACIHACVCVHAYMHVSSCTCVCVHVCVRVRARC